MLKVELEVVRDNILAGLVFHNRLGGLVKNS